MPRSHPSQPGFRAPTRPRAGLVLLVLLAAVAVARVLAGPSLIAPRPPTLASEAPAAGSSGTAPSSLPPDARAYASRLATPLRAAAGIAADLVRMGDEKTRNIFALRDAQAKMTAQLDAVDALLANQTPPAAVAPAVASYRNGSGKVRTAMDEAWAGFTRLDWDRVARATDLLRDGAATLERAVQQLDAPAVASPAAG